jgi:Flp pilus assembly protein TadG
MRRRERCEGIVGFAICLLALLFIVLGIAQFGLWYHAQTVVLGAAREGANAAALEGASPDDGVAVTRRLVQVGLGRYGAGVQVNGDGDAEVSVVEARGGLPAIVRIPGVMETLPLRARAVAYREAFRP